MAEDFECDFNYQRASDGTCKLVPGFTPPDHSAVCKDKNVVEYFKPTGYRRLPASTCEGGIELDKKGSVACPGREEQWKKKHGGVGAFGVFVLVLLSLGAAAAAGWFAWTRVLSGSFGAIRLGEESQSNLMQYPIIVLSAVVAVALALRVV